jgi:hypothetical protein
MSSEIQTCSPEHPMPKGATGRWQHTNTEEVGDQQDGWPGGDIITVRCKDCGHQWTQELPR